MTEQRRRAEKIGTIGGRSETRRIQIYRLWSRLSGARSFAAKRSWWGAFDGESMGLGLAGLVAGLTAPVEASLLGVGWDYPPFGWIGKLPGTVVSIAVAVAWIVGALSLGHLVGQRVSEPLRPRAWLRVARPLVAGFPGLGMGSFPLWRYLATSHPSWAYTLGLGEGSRPIEHRPSSGWDWLPAVSGRSALVPWLMGFVALGLAIVWISVPGGLAASPRTVLIGVAVALHAVGLVGSILYVRSRRRKGASWLSFLLAGCWLLPQPLALGAFAPLGLDLRRLREETLSWRAYAQHNQPGRLTRWSRLEGAVRNSWRATPWWLRWSRPVGRRLKTEPTSADRALLRLGGAKQSLLLIDGVAACWTFVITGDAEPVPAWLGPLVLFLLAATGGGLLIVFAGHLAAALRVVRGPRPLGGLRQTWSGAISLGVVDLGIVVGATLAAGDGRKAGITLVYGGALAMVVLAFGMVLQLPMVVGGARGLDLALSWVGVFMGLMIVGGFVAAYPVVASALLVMALLTPLWHGILYRLARSRLERCLGQAAPVEGVSSTAARASLPARLILVLPFGGLAVPWWLRLRDRQVHGAPDADWAAG